MKPIVIALKDLKQSYRSASALVFMFVLPLLVTGMFYLMFGKQSTQPDASLPITAARIVVVNLDLGDEDLSRGLTAVNMPGVSMEKAGSLGDLLLASLQEPYFADLLTVTTADSQEEAQNMLDEQSADLALIIPVDFSSRYTSVIEPAEVTLYSRSDAPLGAAAAKAVIERILENFAGLRIATMVATADLTDEYDAVSTARDAALMYAQAMAGVQDPSTLIDLREPPGVRKPMEEQASPLANVVGPIMGGMLIFFAFYTGASTAQTILKESEQGTLARMFTTATRPSAILFGKFLSVGLTVLVQVVVLLVAARWIFGIRWGALPGVALTALGVITCASAFGIFLASLVKTTRQSGAVYGGLLTVTGMVGMLPIFTGGGGVSAMNTVSLLMPQGWAVRGLTLSMQGADLSQIALNLLALLAISVTLMAAGVWKFQRRFAY